MDQAFRFFIKTVQVAEANGLILNEPLQGGLVNGNGNLLLSLHHVLLVNEISEGHVDPAVRNRLGSLVEVWLVQTVCKCHVRFCKHIPKRGSGAE